MCRCRRVVSEISRIAKCDRKDWQFARIDRVRKILLLRRGSKQKRRILHELFVIFRELETVDLECSSEVIQFRPIVMAGCAGRLVLPRKCRNRHQVRRNALERYQAYDGEKSLDQNPSHCPIQHWFTPFLVHGISHKRAQRTTLRAHCAQDIASFPTHRRPL